MTISKKEVVKNKPTLVIVLGGNALLERGKPLEIEVQRKNIDLTAKTIAQLTQHWRVVLVHGSGSQVGLLALQNNAYAHVAPYLLDTLGVEGQGMIGYTLQQTLKNQLPQREISVLLTQVEVDANDPAFSSPTEYIGPVYDHTQTQILQAEKGWVFKTDNHPFCRVVPSPQPKHVVERDTIQTLVVHDHLMIYNGGSGVSVVEKANGYHGIEAVIDKDFLAALLASQIHADTLLVLTDANAVYLDWGKSTQRPLAQVTPELLNGVQFDVGSMGPKVIVCAKFVSQYRSIAGIGSFVDDPEILAGDKDILIRLDTPRSHA